MNGLNNDRIFYVYTWNAELVSTTAMSLFDC